MKKYFENESCVLWHGDSRNVLDVVKNGSLLILDPPFDKWKNVQADLPACSSMVAFTNSQNRHATEEVIGAPDCELVWFFKDGRWTSHKMPRHCHEYIFIYGQRHEVYVGEVVTDRRPVKKGVSSIGKWTDGKERTYQPRSRKMLNSVQEFPRNVSSDLGVWSKPVPLMSRMIEWLTEEGELVIDMFSGSGTSFISALDLNRKVIGIELEESNCEIIARRIEQHLKDSGQIELGFES